MGAVRTRRVIDIAGADTVIAAAEAYANEQGYRVLIAVVDPAGELVALRRTQDAQIASARVAVDGAAPLEAGARGGLEQITLERRVLHRAEMVEQRIDPDRRDDEKQRGQRQRGKSGPEPPSFRRTADEQIRDPDYESGQYA